MDMIIYTGAGGLTQIHTEIKTIGAKCFSQDLNGAANDVVVLVKFIASQFFQASDMPIGGYHKVTGTIGVGVHNDKIPLSPIQDIIYRVIALFLPGLFT